MKKRSFDQAFKPEELSHRFKSKTDFVRYFKESRKSFNFCTLIRCSLAVRPSGYHGQQGFPEDGPRRQEEAHAFEGRQLRSGAEVR